MASELTASQITELARQFEKTAQIIHTYREENFTDFSLQENDELRELHYQILNAADELYTTSARIVVQDVSSALTEIKEITEDIKDSFEHIRNIQKVLNVAAAVATLVSSLLTKDPQTIAEAISNLVSTWKEDEPVG